MKRALIILVNEGVAASQTSEGRNLGVMGNFSLVPLQLGGSIYYTNVYEDFGACFHTTINLASLYSSAHANCYAGVDGFHQLSIVENNKERVPFPCLGVFSSPNANIRLQAGVGIVTRSADGEFTSSGIGGGRYRALTDWKHEFNQQFGMIFHTESRLVLAGTFNTSGLLFVFG